MCRTMTVSTPASHGIGSTAGGRPLGLGCSTSMSPVRAPELPSAGRGLSGTTAHSPFSMESSGVDPVSGDGTLKRWMLPDSPRGLDSFGSASWSPPTNSSGRSWTIVEKLAVEQLDSPWPMWLEVCAEQLDEDDDQSMPPLGLAGSSSGVCAKCSALKFSSAPVPGMPPQTSRPFSSQAGEKLHASLTWRTHSPLPHLGFGGSECWRRAWEK
mmetsp:Transcript_126079/g.356530  ORF Transcript_126079/g.356530 Transcript_126079/m.356530 type:complete len:212 (+) Transcript_126079:696-1331(+)